MDDSSRYNINTHVKYIFSLIGETAEILTYNLTDIIMQDKAIVNMKNKFYAV